jgi:hypothetical protein
MVSICVLFVAFLFRLLCPAAAPASFCLCPPRLGTANESRPQKAFAKGTRQPRVPLAPRLPTDGSKAESACARLVSRLFFFCGLLFPAALWFPNFRAVCAASVTGAVGYGTVAAHDTGHRWEEPASARTVTACICASLFVPLLCRVPSLPPAPPAAREGTGTGTRRRAQGKGKGDRQQRIQEEPPHSKQTNPRKRGRNATTNNTGPRGTRSLSFCCPVCSPCEQTAEGLAGQGSVG